MVFSNLKEITSMKLTKRFSLLATAGLVLVMAAALAFNSPKVSAAGRTYVYNQHGFMVPIFNCPADPNPIPKACYNTYWVNNNTPATMKCYYDARYSYTGNYASKRWFFVSINNKTDWVHSSFVFNQTSVSKCTTPYL
jgi:hypothetical protein